MTVKYNNIDLKNYNNNKSNNSINKLKLELNWKKWDGLKRKVKQRK